MDTQPSQISGQLLYSVERRKHLRYQLDFPAIFSWESSQRSRLQGEGITRDIGPFGAFVFTSISPPPVETTIQIEVLLPPLPGTKVTIKIKGEARVLRVEPRRGKGNTSGFAVRSDGFNLYPPATDKTKSAFNTVKRLLESRRNDE